jgi:hypothetical protein
MDVHVEQSIVKIVRKSAESSIVNLTGTFGTQKPNTAVVTIDFQGQHVTTQGSSFDGPLDAIAKAIKKAVPHDAELVSFMAKSLGKGTSAKAQVTIVLKIDGAYRKTAAVDADTGMAFAVAYFEAVRQSRFMCS